MKTKSARCAACAAVALCLTAGLARAEGSVGLAVGAVPDYIGSDDFTAAPFPSFTFPVGRVEVRNNGLGVEVNLGARGVVTGWGPILRYDLGRNDGDKVDDPVVALTAPVKGSLEIGGFVETAFPLGQSANPTLLTARLSVVQGLDGWHEGLLAEASVGVLRTAGDWTLGATVNVAATDGDYADAYFSVSAADAAASGLATYDAAGGVRDVGVSLFASYAVNDRWSLDLLAGYSELVGDAADSPLVRERGDKGQPFIAVGATWRFD